MVRLTCLMIVLAPLLVADNSIRNFQPVDVSNAELGVTVEYTWSGNEDPVFIHATPEEQGGVFDPRTVDFDELRVRPGTHTATLSITKSEGARDFTSVQVRVCMSTMEKALLCQDFPHEKHWRAAAPVEPPPPLVAPPETKAAPPQPAPPVQGTCSISGELSGPLEGVIHPDHPGGSATRVRLREVALMRPGADQPLRAAVKNRRYTFSKLEAGVVYRVSLVGFRSDPPFRNVRCTADTNHRRNFKILGAIQH